MNAQATLLSDRTLLEVAGDERVSFIQGLITNDVERLATGTACFAGLLSPQGKILFDFFVLNLGESLLIDCPASTGAELLKRLTFYKLRAKITIAEVSARWRVAAAWGDGAAQWADAHASVSYRDPRFTGLGLRLLLDGTGAPDLLDSPGGYAALRTAYAIPDGGKDYAYGDTFPHEACFDLLHGIDFKKGCYVGQEVVSRMQHRGTARTRVLAVSAERPLPEGGVDILADGFAVGRLGSVAGNRGVALARLDRVRDALAKGQSLVAGDVPVVLSVPVWASYSLDAQIADGVH